MDTAIPSIPHAFGVHQMDEGEGGQMVYFNGIAREEKRRHLGV